MRDDELFMSRETLQKLHKEGIIEELSLPEEPQGDPIDVEYVELDESTLSYDGIPVHEAMSVILKGMPSVGVNWLAKKCSLSKKKIKVFLETGQGLPSPHVLLLVGVIKEKAEKIAQFEEQKKERERALAAL